jgi:hypothetical protein
MKIAGDVCQVLESEVNLISEIDESNPKSKLKVELVIGE